MKNEEFSLKELQKEKKSREKDRDYSLSGKTGSCFIRGDKIIKLYDYSKKYDTNNDLTKYKSERISFPVDYLYQKGKIIGEVLPYFKAEDLEKKVNSRSNINFLINACQEVEKEISRFPNILMRDIWGGNILYSSKKGMYIIDTTDWEVGRENYSPYNLRLFENSLLVLIENLILTSDRQTNNEILKILYEYISDGESLLELYKDFKKMISLKYNYDIKNVADAKKYIKIIKRS